MTKSAVGGGGKAQITCSCDKGVSTDGIEEREGRGSSSGKCISTTIGNDECNDECSDGERANGNCKLNQGSCCWETRSNS